MIALNFTLAVLYFALAKAGQLLAIPPGYVTIVWPAAGLAFAACLKYGSRRAWPGILIGSFALNATLTPGPEFWGAALVIAVGSTLQALLGAYLTRRIDPLFEISRARESALFVAVSVLSCLVAPSIGNTALVMAGEIDVRQVPLSFLAWWMGDAFGVAIFMPLFIALVDPRPLWHRRRVQVGVPLLFAALLCGIIFQLTRNQEAGRLSPALSGATAPESALASVVPASSVVLFMALVTCAALVQFMLLISAEAERIANEVRVQTAQLRDEVERRKASDEAVRASERQYRQLVETAQEGIWVIDENNVTTLANRRIGEILGWEASDLIGTSLFEHMDEEGRKLAALHVESRKQGVAEEHEFLFQRKDGSKAWTQLSTSPLHDASGRYAGALAMVTDISARKRRDLAGADARRLLQDTIDGIPFRVFVKDAESRIVVMNKAAGRAWGHAANEVLGTDCRQIFPPGQIEGFLAADQAAFTGRQSIEIEEEIWEAPRKESRPHRTFKNPVFDEEGKPLYLVCASIDVGDQKQAAEQLRASEERLKIATDSGRVAVWEVNLKTSKLTWDENCFLLYKMSKEQGAPTFEEWSTRLHKDDLAGAVAAFQSAAAGGEGYHPEFRIVWPSGEVRNIKAHGRVIRDPSGNPERMIGTNWDVTEYRVAERAISEALARAEAAHGAKNDFLSSMSHELRTPLNAVLGFAQVLQLDPELNAEATRFAKEIERSGQHLLILINDVLNLAQIESQGLAIVPEAVQVSALLQDTLRLVAPIASARGIELVEDTSPFLGPVAVFADPTRLRQVVINLLSNAIKYNHPKGKVSLSCSRTETLVDGTAAPRLRLSVTDTGPGIPVEKQARLFAAFDRLGAERSTIEGSGIGLMIARRVAEAMGGSIGFKSSPGQGSTFWVELPAAPLADVPTPRETGGPRHDAKASGSRADSRSGSAGKNRPIVLYIEDAPSSQRLMRSIFARWPQLDLRDAHSPELGLSLAQVLHPALILMDVNLPGLSGIECLAILRAETLTAGIPVIAVTADASDADRDRGLKAGFARYLTKPFNLPELYQSIEGALDLQS